MEALKKQNKNIETRSVTTDILSPREYLKVHDKRSGSIKQVEFIRPKLGERHFGKFRVTYKYPTFKPIE